MSFVDLPPQVRAECDKCGEGLEYDGVTMHLNKDTAWKDIDAYDWHAKGDRLLCEDCSWSEDVDEEEADATEQVSESGGGER